MNTDRQLCHRRILRTIFGFICSTRTRHIVLFTIVEYISKRVVSGFSFSLLTDLSFKFSFGHVHKTSTFFLSSFIANPMNYTLVQYYTLTYYYLQFPQFVLFRFLVFLSFYFFLSIISQVDSHFNIVYKSINSAPW